jgi:MinD superfamily P-loop ATPase
MSGNSLREITVLSGKGGTGKTSLVAAFASLAAPVVCADCDVDAADLHLIARPEISERGPFIGGKKAEVSDADCTGCGECADFCRFEAVTLAGDTSGRTTARIDPFSCEGCGACVRFCPEGALGLEEQEEGEWFVSDTRFGPMVHARLKFAGEASGLLVTRVRETAKTVARDRGIDTVLIDGSPGIGCPVIASTVASDLVLAVCEPTLSGLHDLRRVMDLAGHFRIPAAVCINKHDINPDVCADIEAFCRDRNAPVTGRLAYSTEFTRAQIKSRSVVEDGGPAAEQVRAVWEATLKCLAKEKPSAQNPENR